LALAGARADLRISLVRERGTTANVVGILPGTDPALRDQAIVIGAHYDHLGLGGENSLAPAQVGTVHPGADDNASGTAGVIALARAFAAAGGARRTLVFAAFGAEETGLLGSAHYVRHPPVPLERTMAMLNLDMIGRLQRDKLYVSGAHTGEGLEEILRAANAGVGLDLTLRGDGYDPSDHTSFLARDRPVLFFFTGTHADYHRPSDTADKINAAGMSQVLRLARGVVAALADREASLAFRRPSRPPAASSRGDRAGGYGPYFGSIPDFGGTDIRGVRLSGVRAGSPAERAGLREGDTIVRFAGVAVGGLEDLTFALRSRRAGDEVEVTFVRDGTPHTVRAVLEPRR
jgi:Zn-dependent M28 family amino/carboxypeptidase